MKSRTVIVTIIIVAALAIAFAAPGSEGDPLVTVSFVEAKLSQLKNDLTDSVNGLSARVDDLVNRQNDEAVDRPEQSDDVTTLRFEALNFPAGSQIVLGASSEFVVRRGTATIVDPDKNNMPDLTAGVDVEVGEIVPLNHHMLCPRRDGRGLLVSDDSADFWVLIKGDYIVIK